MSGMSDEQPKTPKPPEIAVLVSGRGSNLDAIFRAIERGELHARVSLVISSRSDAPALEIARQHGAETRVIAPKSFASRAGAGAVIVAALRDAEFVVRPFTMAILAAKVRQILDAPARARMASVRP